MSTPVLHLLAGPNGAGKTTFVTRVLQPVTHLPFINADHIAAERWSHDPTSHAYEAAQQAATERLRLMEHGQSFVTETVFSHPSKVSLVEHAIDLGYLVHLHIVMVPVDLTVQRVAERVRRGGHPVPEAKIRERYARLWPLIAAARDTADHAECYDNSRAGTPFRLIATYLRGRPVGAGQWPTWTPAEFSSVT